MNVSRPLLICISVLLAALTTGSLYYFNTQRQTEEQVDFALKLAQQAGAQTETLVARARERLESDPIDWAIRALAVGPESRLILMAPLKVTPALEEAEKYRFNTKTGTLSYLRVIDTASREGVRIHVQLGYSGYLGARTKWISDIYATVTFLLTLCFFMPLTRILKKPNQETVEIDPLETLDSTFEKEESELSWSLFDPLDPINPLVPEPLVAPSVPPLAELPTPRLPTPILAATPLPQLLPPPPIAELTTHEEHQTFVATVSNWSGEARTSLMQLGIQVKNMTQQAKELVDAATQSRESVESLTQTTTQLHELTQELNKALATGDSNMSQIRVNFGQLKDLTEKSVTEADLSFHCQKNIFQAGQELSTFITQTKDALINQAKLVQNLKDGILTPAKAGNRDKATTKNSQNKAA